jgi:hypothetical protein
MRAINLPEKHAENVVIPLLTRADMGLLKPSDLHIGEKIARN